MSDLTATNIDYIDTNSNLGDATDVQTALDNVGEQLSTIDALLTNKLTPVIDTWHDLTLDANFLSAGGSGTVKYRLNKIGQLELDISLFTIGANRLVGVLPEGYRPSTTRNIDQSLGYDFGWTTTFMLTASLNPNGNLNIGDSDIISDSTYNKFLIVSLD